MRNVSQKVEEQEPVKDRKSLWNPLTVTLLVACLLLIAALCILPFVKSPAQIAADAAAPSATRQTASVRTGQVTDVLSVNGTIAPAGERIIRPVASSEDAKAIISMVGVTPGAEVTAGQVVLAVSGHPVIILPGEAPSFRNLGPGMTGADVTQLQAALRSLGIEVSDADGTYGSSTSQAVTKMYADRGYTPTTIGKDDVETAKEAVTSATRARDDAKVALTRSEAALARLSAAEESERVSGKDAVADAQKALTRAKEDLSKAQSNLSKAQEASGVSVPLGEVEFVSSLPARVASVGLSVGQAAGEGTITLSAGVLVVNVELPGLVHKVVAAEQTAEVITDTGETLTAVVRTLSSPVAAASTTGGQTSEQNWTARLESTAPIPETLRGHDVRVSITTKTSDKGLVVPVACVSTGTDGKDRVFVLREGKSEAVVVALGANGQGEVRVTPIEGSLAEGDQILVGAQDTTIRPQAAPS